VGLIEGNHLFVIVVLDTKHVVIERFRNKDAIMTTNIQVDVSSLEKDTEQFNK
jgi:hypothetical protein